MTTTRRAWLPVFAVGASLSLGCAASEPTAQAKDAGVLEDLATDTVAAPDTGDAPDAPAAVDAPVAPDEPAALDTPAVVDRPEAPDTPAVADVPAVDVAPVVDVGSCGASPACTGGRVCCGGACEDLSTSLSNCAVCGLRCALPGATATCSAGRCAVGACLPGFADCDLSAADGCEVGTDADVRNCGACARACAPAHATAACRAGVCAVAACDEGYADCDASAADGCESSLAGDAANCGVCGNRCGGGLGCSRSTCVPAEGLVAWYPFDNDLREVVYGADGAATDGAVTFVADRFGRASSAASFDGTAYVLAPANVRLPVGGSPRTLSLWMRTSTTFSAEAGALANWGTTATRQRFGLLVEQTGSYGYFVGEGADLAGTTVVIDERWRFLAATFDGATVRLYVDAVEERSGAIALDTTGTALLVGRSLLDHYPGRPAPELYRGAIDDVRVYDRALTPDDVRVLRTEGMVRP